jgi:hypothetical protein
MGHAGGTGSITLDVNSKSWWEERVHTVTRIVEPVMTEQVTATQEKNAYQDRPRLYGHHATLTHQ